MREKETLTTDKMAERNEALSALLHIASQRLPLTDLLEKTLETLLSLSWLSILKKGGIFLTEEDATVGKKQLRLVVKNNLGLIGSLCEVVNFGRCLCGRAAETKQVQYADCVDHRHEISFEGMEDHGHYNLPILSNEEVLGVLVLYLQPGKQSNDGEREFLHRVVAIIALMITLHRSIDALEKVNQELKQQQFALDQHAIVSMADRTGNITYVNKKFCDLSEYTKQELMGQNHRLLKSGEHSEEFYKNMWKTITNSEVWTGEVKNKKKNGGYYWVQSTIVPLLDERGKPYQYVSIRTDISNQKFMEESFDEAQKVANIGSWHLDLVKDELSWTDQIYRIFGIDKKSFSASFEGFIDTIHPEDREYVISEYGNSVSKNIPYNIEHRIIRKDTGEIRWVHEQCVHRRNAANEVILSDGTVQDITERKIAQDEIRRLAMTDQLTGLANRHQFNRRFGESLKLAQREQNLLALLLLDLDKFKPINDSFGHQVGDKFLKYVSELLQKNCRETDVVARLGGDEFAIILVHPESTKDVEQCAQRIVNEFKRSVYIEGNEVHGGTSIGISICPMHSNDMEGLTQKADLALYHAKESERNSFSIYSQDMEK